MYFGALVIRAKIEVDAVLANLRLLRWHETQTVSGPIERCEQVFPDGSPFRRRPAPVTALVYDDASIRRSRISRDLVRRC